MRLVIGTRSPERSQFPNAEFIVRIAAWFNRFYGAIRRRGMKRVLQHSGESYWIFLGIKRTRENCYEVVQPVASLCNEEISEKNSTSFKNVIILQCECNTCAFVNFAERNHVMKHPHNWKDFVSLALGICAFLSSWIIGHYTGPLVIVNYVIAGILISFFAITKAADPHRRSPRAHSF
jgi:SPW repeat